MRDRLLRRGTILWVVATVLATPTAAEELSESAGYLSRPQPTPLGIVVTDNYSSSLSLVAGGELLQLFSAPGCGRYYSLSPDRTRLGFKQITQRGDQIPAILDLATGEVFQLHAPVRQAGQVSFSQGGKTAFTIGQHLIVRDGPTTVSHDLGVYANIAPISPDGKQVAYNDRADQLWLLNLTTGERIRLTDGDRGFFQPIWSPNSRVLLYSSLNGFLSLYDLSSRETHSIGEGYSPTWSGDSRAVVFYRKEIAGGKLLNSDLYLFDLTERRLQRLTETPDIKEMDPSFEEDGKSLVCHTYERREILKMQVNGSRDRTQAPGFSTLQVLDARNQLSIPHHPMDRTSQVVSAIDIPYIHQVYDTPDWFNGHWACAPTQAMMLLAYHNVLPPWQTWCSSPSPGHYSYWGRYVAEQYMFRGIDYWYYAYDPNDQAARGGYGYMWTGSWSPHTRMAGYFQRHGLEATQTESTPYSVAYAEIAAGYPYSMCVMLTSAGHLVLAHGIGPEPHTFVFNDPYGNKNSGYMNYHGKNVMYDWPGYNNGNQNLNGVAWCIATRHTELAPADTLVDDLHLGQGFYMHTTRPASMEYWKDKVTGYENHMWWTFTQGGPSDTCYAVWTPDLPSGGYYEVFAYIPFSNATSAVYRVGHAGGEELVFVNQKEVKDDWTSLGTYWFEAGTDGTVRLGDKSNDPGQEIIFDALRWSPRGSPVAVDSDRRGEHPTAFALDQNSPNPFNPSTSVNFAVPVGGWVRVSVYDLLGREVEVLVDEQRGPGTYTVSWNASGMASGIYFYQLRAGATVLTRKMVLVR
jgi:WD40 repeat protein